MGNKLISDGNFWRLADKEAGNSWAAWQYHLGPEDAGVAYFHRREANSVSTVNLSLRRIDPELTYLVEIFRATDLLCSERMVGARLMELTVTIPEVPGTLLIQYSKLSPGSPMRKSKI